MLARCFAPGDVAGSGAHGKSATARSVGDHSNRPVRANARRGGGHVSDGVLVANLPGDTVANIGYSTKLAGKEGFPAGGLWQAMAHPRIPVQIAFVEQTNGVDDGAGAPGEVCHLS